MTYYEKGAFSYSYYSQALPEELITPILKTIKSIEPDDYTTGLTFNETPDSSNLKKVRDSSVYWIEEEHWISSIFRHYFEMYNRQIWEYDLNGIESIQVSKYDTNGHYSWHCDYGLDNNEDTRKLSASLLLSDETEFSGGDLQLIDYHGNTITLPKVKGSIVVFDSRIPNRVTKVLSGTRVSLVSWMRGPKLR